MLEWVEHCPAIIMKTHGNHLDSMANFKKGKIRADKFEHRLSYKDFNFY
jgi:hypothetical protein